MSYDISLFHPGTTTQIILDKKHHMKGGTYELGGSWEAGLNVTYNYAKIYDRVIGRKGIRVIYGLTGAGSIPILEKAIAELGDDVDEDYWKATEGNAKAALKNLLELAKLQPDGVWNGD